jgi:hypothetical protein
MAYEKRPAISVVIRKNDGTEIEASRLQEIGWRFSDPCPFCGAPLFKREADELPAGRACVACQYEETGALIPVRDQFISAGWTPPKEEDA